MEESAEASTPLKRVLIVAYYWPPAGGPGVQRWLKFAKYLPECGWEPTLLVPDGAAYPVMDASLESDIPRSLKVIRVPIFEPYETALRLFQKQGAERLGSGGTEQSGWTGTLLRWMRGNVLLPDPRVLWRRPATRAAALAIRKMTAAGQPFDAIVTTGPPHSVHLIGRALKKRFGLPWLADFRDLWREMDYLQDFLPTSRTNRRHAQMEASVLNLADAITHASPSAADSFAANGAEGTAQKLHLLYNGWDPKDLGADAEPPASLAAGQFHLGHFGSLFPTRDMPGLWKAIHQWNQAVPAGRIPIHIHLYGSISPPVRHSLHRHLDDGEWTDHGYVNHTEAVHRMNTMDALLLVQNDNDTGQRSIPGKAFEYLATGQPLAVVTPVPSDLATLVSSWGLAPTPHADETGFLSLLDGLFDGQSQLEGLASKYTRQALTRELAQHLNAMVAKNH